MSVSFPSHYQETSSRQHQQPPISRTRLFKSITQVVDVLVQFGEFANTDIYQRGLYNLQCRLYSGSGTPGSLAVDQSATTLTAPIRIDAMAIATYPSNEDGGSQSPNPSSPFSIEPTLHNTPVFPHATLPRYSCPHPHSACTWRCRPQQPPPSSRSRRDNSRYQPGPSLSTPSPQQAVDEESRDREAFFTVFRSPTFAVEYQGQRINLQSGVVFRLECEVLGSEHRMNWEDEGLFSQMDFEHSPTLHDHTLLQFDSIFFSSCDLVISTAFLGYRFDRFAPTTTGSPLSPEARRISTEVGCGSGGFWDWIGRRILSVGNSGDGEAPSVLSARAARYLAEQSEFDVRALPLMRRAVDYESMADIEGYSWSRYYHLLTVSASAIVDLQSAIIHTYALRATLNQGNAGMKSTNLSFAMTVDQIVAIFTAGTMRNEGQVVSDSIRRDSPAIGADGISAALAGCFKGLKEMINNGNEYDVLIRIVSALERYSIKINHMWRVFLDEFGIINVRDIKYIRMSSGRLRMMLKEVYILDSMESESYDKALSRIQVLRDERNFSILEPCDEKDPPILYDISRLARTQRFAQSVSSIPILAPRRTETDVDQTPKVATRSTALSPDLISFRDYGSINLGVGTTPGRAWSIVDEEASVRGLVAPSILSDVMSPSLMGPSAQPGPGIRLMEIEAALDASRSRRGGSLSGGVGYFPISVPTSVINPSSLTAQASVPFRSQSPDLDEGGNNDTSTASKGVHLIVFVHGLLGSSFDLRQYKNRIITALYHLDVKDSNHEFLISSSNEDDTFDDIEILADNLVTEILEFVGEKKLVVDKISHANYLKVLKFYQILGRSKCIDQLNLKDHKDPRQTLLYRLTTTDSTASDTPGLHSFKHVRFLASPQDGYVPLFSALAENEPPASKWLSNLSCLADDEMSYLHSQMEINNQQDSAMSLATMSFAGNGRGSAGRSGLMATVYKEMVRNLKVIMSGAAGGEGPDGPTVEKYLVKFGSVERCGGFDVLRRRAHIAMLEDPGFAEILVLHKLRKKNKD
ncbi:hypothetical protein HDU76_010748 [Blyttiomyces sp. JEL0837]|nr:hypothetical protein HDU76_010748 [Blyttiomyces sp. JEL0837]